MTPQVASLGPLVGQSAGVWAVLIGAALFGGAMLVILVLLSRSLKQLRAGATRFAQGDLSQRVVVTGPLQVSALAESLNAMAAQLDDRLNAVVQQRNELGAVLGSMVEGVLAIDHEQNILSLNPAAADLLGLDPLTTIGRSILECIRNPALQQFVAHTLDQDAAVQAEIAIRPAHSDADDDRLLEVQSAILRDAAGRRIGAVIVLHDVTQLRRLENVRREFVANVSHEVKTPVSAIKAAVETLLDTEGERGGESKRFLEMILRQADRLAAIVDDLLALARIEQSAEQITAELSSGRIAPVLMSARETCQANADQRQMQMDLECESNLSARINARLLEQAVVNLLDNAIKYSPVGSRIRLCGRRADSEVIIEVMDEGRGIEPQHLPRLFERFYRTDKARSRALGGTGLGLSIVKHIAEAHGGRVSVESRINKGSTFRIHLTPG
ncbi:MAG: PAS domain-containing protein [Phycisphaeraceae bacterium]|nr:PAS domain-containing protein [Phycisphaeraceae bacterium]